MTRLGFHPHIAPMIENSLPRKREPQTQAVAFAGADKWLEQMFTDLWRDARPGVFYLNEGALTLAGGADRDGAAIGHSFERIADKIDEHALNARALER